MKVVYSHNGFVKEAVFDAAYTPAAGRNNFSPSLVESAVKAILLQGEVCNTIFPNRPKASPEPSSEFLVVSLRGNLEDMQAYGTCTLLVGLYAKDAQSVKNNKKLGILQDKVMDWLPMSADVYNGDSRIASYEIDNTPYVFGDSSDDYGYHARIIEFEILIKVL